jgi:hypothetical protein
LAATLHCSYSSGQTNAIKVIVSTNMHVVTDKVHSIYILQNNNTSRTQIIMMVHMHWFEEANETQQLQSSMATQSLSHPVADQVRPVYPCDILILTYYVIMLSVITESLAQMFTMHV